MWPTCQRSGCLRIGKGSPFLQRSTVLSGHTTRRFLRKECDRFKRKETTKRRIEYLECDYEEEKGKRVNAVCIKVWKLLWRDCLTVWLAIPVRISPLSHDKLLRSVFFMTSVAFYTPTWNDIFQILKDRHEAQCSKLLSVLPTRYDFPHNNCKNARKHRGTANLQPISHPILQVLSSISVWCLGGSTSHLAPF